MKYDVAVTSRSFSKNEYLRSLLLKKYKNVKFNDAGKSLKGDDLAQFLKDTDKAIVALEVIDQELLSKLPNLKILSKYGVGLNNIDPQALIDNNIKIGHTPGVNKRAVSELTLAMMIALLRNIYYANQEVKNSKWRQIKGHNLTGKTVGIIGLGNVGKDLARLLGPFECRILSFDIRNYDQFCHANDIAQCSLHELLSKSDIITVHVPLYDKTKDMISEAEFKVMKTGVHVLNTARGGIINEDALFSALKSGQVAGASFDVLTTEPPEDFKLINHPNFFITPHIGGSSVEAINAMGEAAIEGLTSAITPTLELGK
ncbi:MAG: phosphoglycerate dehydrogenase [Bacteriovoracaceae bacterium]|nr:phosphoglycerate dehydrogenase [Bacteriovoracaceae bacterium]